MRSSLLAIVAFSVTGFACGAQLPSKSSTAVDDPTGNHPDMAFDPTQLPNCGSQSFAVGASKLPPSVMLVIDRSGSMSEMAGSLSKWDSLKSAVHTLFGEDGMAIDPTKNADIDWGLTLFPKQASAQCTAGVVNTPMANADATQVLSILDPIQSIQDNSRALTDPNVLGPGTPTPETLAQVRDSGGLTDATRNNVVLLMTDGIPNCSANSEKQVTDIIGQLYARTPSVKSYVVGLGTETNSNPQTLNEWAKAGHTDRTGAASAYYQANNADDLKAAFADIVSGVSSCTYHLDAAPADPNLLSAYLNGQVIANDTTNGVSYDGKSQSLVFNGSSCDQLKAGDSVKIDILYGCKGAPIL